MHHLSKSSTSPMGTFNHGHFKCCYQNWIAQQQEDLEELLCVLAHDPHDEEKLQLLKEKSLRHFQEYCDNRSILAQRDAPSFFSPSWCTTFENSFLWIGGCRPSLSIRLVYALGGSEIKAHLTEFLRGERNGNLGEISPHQLNLINSLHRKILREEDKLSKTMASLQEDIADEPLVLIAKFCKVVGESSPVVDQALDAHSLALARLLGEADKLRLSTMREIMTILTPLQAVDLLVASKKLHLSIHEWGKKRDEQIGKS